MESRHHTPISLPSRFLNFMYSDISWPNMTILGGNAILPGKQGWVTIYSGRRTSCHHALTADRLESNPLAPDVLTPKTSDSLLDLRLQVTSLTNTADLKCPDL